MPARRVPPEGPESAEWAVVGEAPGASETAQGRPFVGPSGQLVRKTLRRVGLDPKEAWITNVVKFRPPNNATPRAPEIRLGREELAAELGALPKLKGILILGNTPLKALTGKTGITNKRGVVDMLPDFAHLGATAFATLHPAAVLRNDGYLNGWREDLAAFRRVVEPSENTDEIIPVDTHAAQHQLCDELYAMGSHHGAIDIETTIADPWLDGVRIVSIAIATSPNRAYVILGDHPDVHPTWRLAMPERLPWLLANRSFICHNGYFDWLRCRLNGVDFNYAHDTLGMQFLLDPDERKGLEYLSGVELGEPPYKDVDYERILEEPIDKIVRMNGIDACRTVRLYRKLAVRLDKHPSLSRIYQKVLMPATRVLMEATQNGVPVDLARLGELEARCRRFDGELEERIATEAAAAGAEEFNPRSSTQVASLLYGAWRLPIEGRTKKGQKPSTSGETLNKLLAKLPDNHPRRGFIRALQEYRTVNTKWLGTYIKGWRELMQIWDGRGWLHPQYKPMFVVSGRLSSFDPNIQNVPRPKTSPHYSQTFREISADMRNVMGGLPGYTWMKADYSQLELRVAAFESRDPRMLEAYQSGEDLHMLTAKLVLGEESKGARQSAKPINFGLLYGASAWRLQIIARDEYDVHFTQAQARRHRSAFFRTYKGLLEYHNRVRRELKATGKIVSSPGRVRYLPDSKSNDEKRRAAAEREAINHPVQSFASDIALLGMVEVRRRLADAGLGARIIAQVHDEIDLLVPHDELTETAALVKATMEEGPKLIRQRLAVAFDVPLVAEIETADYWGGAMLG